MSTMVSYEPLWNTLKKRNISSTQLVSEYGISPETIAALKTNKNITVKTVHDICLSLRCGIADVMEFR